MRADARNEGADARCDQWLVHVGAEPRCAQTSIGESGCAAGDTCAGGRLELGADGPDDVEGLSHGRPALPPTSPTSPASQSRSLHPAPRRLASHPLAASPHRSLPPTSLWLSRGMHGPSKLARPQPLPSTRQGGRAPPLPHCRLASSSLSTSLRETSLLASLSESPHALVAVRVSQHAFPPPPAHRLSARPSAPGPDCSRPRSPASPPVAFTPPRRATVTAPAGRQRERPRGDGLRGTRAGPTRLRAHTLACALAHPCIAATSPARVLSGAQSRSHLVWYRPLPCMARACSPSHLVSCLPLPGICARTTRYGEGGPVRGRRRSRRRRSTATASASLPPAPPPPPPSPSAHPPLATCRADSPALPRPYTHPAG